MVSLNRKSIIISCLILFLSIVFNSFSPVLAAEEYKLGPGDVLEILVWNDEQLSKQVVVPPDCMISYPLAGDFNVKGITVAALEEKMQEQLKKYLPNTPVTVSLLAANDLKVFVLGKVNKPGVFPINLETNVMQALAMAGGLSTFANEKRILLLRHEDSKVTKLYFNYSNIEKGESLEQNVILKRGDVIVVP